MKATPTTTALAITAIPSVEPKPTRSEIIEALVIRSKEKIDKENSARLKRRDDIRKKIDKLAIKIAKTMEPKVDFYVSSKPDQTTCDVRFAAIKTPELVELFKEYHENSRVIWDEKETRKAIREELSKPRGFNPDRLLKNPDSLKAIDAMLDKWGI